MRMERLSKALWELQLSVTARWLVHRIPGTVRGCPTMMQPRFHALWSYWLIVNGVYTVDCRMSGPTDMNNHGTACISPILWN